MADDSPITQWIGAVKERGDPDAEQGLWQEYFARLQALARVKLANYEDGEDVALSAMKSFFRRAREGQFPNLHDRTELWTLLAQTAIWKVHNLRRRKFAKKRDVRKVISLDWLRENQPTAELADKVVEEGNALLESLTDDKLRTVAGMKLDGYTNAEIAERIGRSVKAVEWRLKQIRKQFLAVMEDGDGR